VFCNLRPLGAYPQIDQVGLQPGNITCCEHSELCNSENYCGAKYGAFSETPVLSPADRQALETIFTLWPGLPPEVKVGVMKMIETATVADVE